MNEPTILIVEDDPIMVLFLEEYLGGTYDIVKAQSGSGALSVFAEGKPPALVVLDLKLPDMSGFDVLASLRSNAALKVYADRRVIRK